MGESYETTEHTEANTKKTEEMSKLTFKDESYRIRGAVYEVYKEMGCGFLEAVYQECLSMEFSFRKIPYVEQMELELNYKGDRLIQAYRPDFICYGEIIVELKAVRKLTDEHRAQLHNYLNASRMRLGFLINFEHFPKVEIERIVKKFWRFSPSVLFPCVLCVPWFFSLISGPFL